MIIKSSFKCETKQADGHKQVEFAETMWKSIGNLKTVLNQILLSGEATFQIKYCHPPQL